jgi:hypothetical protein
MERWIQEKNSHADTLRLAENKEPPGSSTLNALLADELARKMRQLLDYPRAQHARRCYPEQLVPSSFVGGSFCRQYAGNFRLFRSQQDYAKKLPMLLTKVGAPAHFQQARPFENGAYKQVQVSAMT